MGRGASGSKPGFACAHRRPRRGGPAKVMENIGFAARSSPEVGRFGPIPSFAPLRQSMQEVQNSKVSVEKIGGTSMTAFGDVLRHIVLHDPQRINGRIYVVSAYSGVTNQLLEHKKTGERGIYALFAEGKGYQDALTQLAVSLKRLNADYAELGLPLAVADAFIDHRIGQAREYLGAMQPVLASGYLSR